MANPGGLNRGPPRTHPVMDAQEPFRLAVDKCLDSFDDEAKSHIRTFSDAAQVISSIEKLYSEPETSIFSLPPSVDAFCKAINRLSVTLQPYHTCFLIFAQAQPEVCGLVWGTAQFIFKLCGHYSSFVTKLAEMIQSLCQDLEFHQGLALIAAQRFETLRTEHVSSDWSDPDMVPLMSAMKSLYCDLLELFCDICSLFSRCRGKRWRGVLATTKPFWVPFDEHFLHFREKFRLYRSIMVQALQQSKETAVTEALEELRGLSESTREQFKGIESQLKQARLDNLKAWIGAQPWTPAFEESKRSRAVGTSTWILDHSQYQWWKDTLRASSEKSEFRVLSIQAKPGYGKSVLCGVIIQSLLENHNQTGKDETLNDSAVGCYYFDKQRSTQNDNASAIRAVVMQLLYQRQENSELLDLALILKEYSNNGETIARLDDLKELFALALKMPGNTSLVFDGLDECGDIKNFLSDLETMIEDSSTRILFSSRPNVKFKNHFETDFRTICLDETENFQDIETYLYPEIDSLVQQRMLMPNDSVHGIVHSIAKKSSSVFLWARLFVSHLSSELMTPQDRMEAINEMSLFPELHSLCSRILGKLFSWHSDKVSRRNLQLLFDWVCMAGRPLMVPELQTALAVEIGRKTSEAREIVDFGETLARLTGALVEVASDKSVRFIHSSVLEFFINVCDHFDTSNMGSPHQSRLHIDKNAIESSMAATCLSYILLDGPRVSLASIIDPPVTTPSILAKFPLLLYATQFWAVHAYRAIGQWDTASDITELPDMLKSRILLQLIGAFISDPLTVTAWTEASWIFGSEPCLNGLPQITAKLSHLKNSPIGNTLKRFCEDLSRLNVQWRHVLQPNPEEIWQPSIPAFLGSSFWVQTEDSHVMSLGKGPMFPLFQSDDKADNPILVASQCGSDGSQIGMIKLWPSTSFRKVTSGESPDPFKLLSIIDDLTKHWMVTYEIRSLRSRKSIHSLHLELPPHQIRKVLEKAFVSQEPTKFKFPVAFSQDLRQITILECLVRILSPETSTPSLEMDSSAIQELEIKSLSEPESCTLGEHEMSLNYPMTNECPCNYSWYHIMFSPNSKYLLVLRGPGKPGKRFLFSRMEFIIYRDEGEAWEQPKFVEVSRTLSNVSPGPSAFVFHPTQPVLAMSQLAVTSLWFFERQKTTIKSIFRSPLVRLAFSRCGSYIHGDPTSSDRTKSYTVINIGDYLDYYLPKSAPPSRDGDKMSPTTPSSGKQVEVRSPLELIASTDPPAIINSNELVFNKQGNLVQITMVSQFNDTGEVLLQKLTEDGVLVSECVTRLPARTDLDTTQTTMLEHGQQAKDFEAVINKTPQDSYSVDDAENQQLGLPLLIKRKRETVPQTSSKRRSLLGWTSDTSKG